MKRPTPLVARMTILLVTLMSLNGCSLRPPNPPPLSGLGFNNICDGGIGIYQAETDPGLPLRWEGARFYVGGGAYSTSTSGSMAYVKPENPDSASDYQIRFTVSTWRANRTSTTTWTPTVKIPPVEVTPIDDGGMVVGFRLTNRGQPPKTVVRVSFQVMTDDGSYHFLNGGALGLSLGVGESVTYQWADFGYTIGQIVAAWPYGVGFNDETGWGDVCYYMKDLYD